MEQGMIRVAIAGASGHSGYVKNTGPENKERVVVAAVIGEGAAMERLSQAYPGASRYASIGDCLANGPIDIGVVNPEFSHIASTAKEFIARRIPVFLEKPFALSMDELDVLFTAAKNGTSVYPMFDMRYSAPYYSAHCLVRDGVIGAPVLVCAQKSYKIGERAAFYRARSTYGGTIPWVAIHAVDFVRFVAGVRYTSVSARHTVMGNGGHNELESAAVMQFTTAEGALVTITADYLRPKAASTHGDDRLRIAGTSGVLEVRGEKVYLIDSGGEKEMPLIAPPRPIFDDVIAYIAGAQDTLASGADGFYATAVALASRESADTGNTADISAAERFLE